LYEDDLDQISNPYGHDLPLGDVSDGSGHPLSSSETPNSLPKLFSAKVMPHADDV